MNLYGREKRSVERKEKEAARKRKHDDEMSQQSGNLVFCQKYFSIWYNLIINL